MDVLLVVLQDRPYMDDTTKEIMSKERVHRTRVTVLQSTGKVWGSLAPWKEVKSLPPSLSPSVFQQHLQLASDGEG